MTARNIIERLQTMGINRPPGMLLQDIAIAQDSFIVQTRARRLTATLTVTKVSDTVWTFNDGATDWFLDLPATGGLRVTLPAKTIWVEKIQAFDAAHVNKGAYLAYSWDKAAKRLTFYNAEDSSLSSIDGTIKYIVVDYIATVGAITDPDAELTVDLQYHDAIETYVAARHEKDVPTRASLLAFWRKSIMLAKQEYGIVMETTDGLTDLLQD